MNKLILLDIDGTITTYQGDVPSSASVAVKKARENGHIVVLVSGRTKPRMINVLETEIDGIIGGNGAYVELHDQVLQSLTISKDDMKEIIEYLESHHLEFFVETIDGIYGSHHFKERGQKALLEYGHPTGIIEEVYPTMLFPESLVLENVTKINFVLESYQDYLDFKETFTKFKCMTWGGQGEKVLFGDCALYNIDKAQAIRIVQDTLSITSKDTYAFGDAEVDIPMFNCADTSICLGGGREAAKKAATYVTANVEDDGLYKAFKHFHLI